MLVNLPALKCKLFLLAPCHLLRRKLVVLVLAFLGIGRLVGSPYPIQSIDSTLQCIRSCFVALCIFSSARVVLPVCVLVTSC